MIKYTTVHGIVTHVANAVNTKEGNPIKRVNMATSDGEELEFLVEPDSTLNFKIENSEYSKKFHTFYVNKNGRLGSMAGQ